MPLRKLLAREITRLLGAGARREFAAGWADSRVAGEMEKSAALLQESLDSVLGAGKEEGQ